MSNMVYANYDSAGKQAFDPGRNESVFGHIYVIGQQHAAVTAAADANENILYSLNIPAGLMGPNDSLRVTQKFSHTNSVNAKTCRTRLGGIGGASLGTIVSTTRVTSGQIVVISNRGAVNSQLGQPIDQIWGSGNTNGMATGSVDMSQAQTLVITGQKATAGETLTLESVLVELIRGV